MAFFDDQAETSCSRSRGSEPRCSHRRRNLHHRALRWTRHGPRPSPRRISPRVGRTDLRGCDRRSGRRGRHASGRSPTAGQRDRRAVVIDRNVLEVATRPVRVPSNAKRPRTRIDTSFSSVTKGYASSSGGSGVLSISAAQRHRPQGRIPAWKLLQREAVAAGSNHGRSDPAARDNDRDVDAASRTCLPR